MPFVMVELQSWKGQLWAYTFCLSITDTKLLFASARAI